LTSSVVLLRDLGLDERGIFIRVNVKAFKDLVFGFLIHSTRIIVGSLGRLSEFSRGSKLGESILILVSKTSEVWPKDCFLSYGLTASFEGGMELKGAMLHDIDRSTFIDVNRVLRLVLWFEEGRRLGFVFFGV
jgi:hypothetical protein